MDYYPYGDIRLDEKVGTFSEQRKFGGHEYDSETGLNYMNARYYSGKTGRFVSQDAAFLAVGDNAKLKALTKLEVERYLADPQLANSYSYVSNNPLKYTDSTGDFLDIALDVGFIGYDLYRMGSAAWNKNWSEVKSESANLGLDVAGAAIPGVTGLGMIRRAGEAVKLADKAVDAGKVIKNVSNEEKYISKVDDIIPPARQNHILNGEPSRNGNYWLGGHKSGTGMGKPEFPSSWSDSQIFHNAADIATDPTLNWTKQPSGRYIVSGIRDGVNMSTVINDSKSVTIRPNI